MACLLIANTQSAFSQTTIGSAIKPKEGVLLDLKQYEDNEAELGGRTANKGLLLPRVKLTTLNDLTDIPDADISNSADYAGMIIYNVGTIPQDDKDCINSNNSNELMVFNGTRWNSVENNSVIAKGIDGNIGWVLESDGTLTLCGQGNMNDYNITLDPITGLITNNTIPWALYTHKIKKLTIKDGITSIGDYAFMNCQHLTGNLTLPNRIKSIGNNSFKGCYNLNGNLRIPNSVISIGDNAFQGCTGFTGDLVIPNSVTSIGKLAFADCSGVTGTLTISNSLTTIKEQTFRGCSNLTGNLTIPNSVTTIEYEGLAYCVNLNGSLALSNSLTNIGDRAFYGCNDLIGDLIIPNSVTTIGESAFSNCSALNGSLTISNSTKDIGNSAFYNCYNLTGDLLIPNSVKTIGDWTFYNCKNFNGTLKIPNSVETIGNKAFEGCSDFNLIYSDCPVSSYNNSYPFATFSTPRIMFVLPYQQASYLSSSIDWNSNKLNIKPY